jgi:hypothetical protein
MNKYYSPILAVVLVIASNVLMFNLGKSTTIEFKSTTMTSTMSLEEETYPASSSSSNNNDNNSKNTSGSSLNAISKFDIIKHNLYKEASKVVKTNRKEFILDEEWERGSGGLDDTDRMVLGKLYYNATSVFEFGLGESTRIAAYTGVPRYSGVDSDPVWVNMARSESKQSHFRFYYADIGDTKMWGYPVDGTLQKIQYNYQIAPLVMEDKPFDVYLVDGRFRVACACISFLHAIKTGGDMERIRVGIHDNDQTTRGYAEFKKVADVVIQNNKLWVYKLKQGTTEDDLYDMWQRLHKTQTR